MSTKIDAFTGTAPALAVGAVGRPRDAAASAAQHPVREPDTLALTGEARLMQQLERQVRADSGVDERKVAEIRRLLEQDRYQADPQVIARRLLQAERDLSP